MGLAAEGLTRVGDSLSLLPPPLPSLQAPPTVIAGADESSGEACALEVNCSGGPGATARKGRVVFLAAMFWISAAGAETDVGTPRAVAHADVLILVEDPDRGLFLMEDSEEDDGIVGGAGVIEGGCFRACADCSVFGDNEEEAGPSLARTGFGGACLGMVLT